MLKFKIGDLVKVTAGKDKDRTGTIEKIYREKLLALVPNVNLFKKHVKAIYDPAKKGGIFELARPLPFASISLICPNCKKQTRVGFRGEERNRYCKKCKKIIVSKVEKKGK